MHFESFKTTRIGSHRCKKGMYVLNEVRWNSSGNSVHCFLFIYKEDTIVVADHKHMPHTIPYFGSTRLEFEHCAIQSNQNAQRIEVFHRKIVVTEQNFVYSILLCRHLVQLLQQTTGPLSLLDFTLLLWLVPSMDLPGFRSGKEELGGAMVLLKENFLLPYSTVFVHP